MRIILIILALVLSGCGPERDVRMGLDNGVYLIELSDGTRCAVYDGPFSGGITCDWEQTREIN